MTGERWCRIWWGVTEKKTSSAEAANWAGHAPKSLPHLFVPPHLLAVSMPAKYTAVFQTPHSAVWNAMTAGATLIQQAQTFCACTSWAIRKSWVQGPNEHLSFPDLWSPEHIIFSIGRRIYRLPYLPFSFCGRTTHHILHRPPHVSFTRIHRFFFRTRDENDELKFRCITLIMCELFAMCRRSRKFESQQFFPQGVTKHLSDGLTHCLNTADSDSVHCNSPLRPRFPYTF